MNEKQTSVLENIKSAYKNHLGENSKLVDFLKEQRLEEEYKLQKTLSFKTFLTRRY